MKAKYAYWIIIGFVVFFLYKGGFLSKKRVPPIDIGRYGYEDTDPLLMNAP